MIESNAIEKFIPEVHQLLLSDRFIVIDRDTGEVIEDGKDGKGYDTAEEAMSAYNAKMQMQVVNAGMEG